MLFQLENADSLPSGDIQRVVCGTVIDDYYLVLKRLTMFSRVGSSLNTGTTTESRLPSVSILANKQKKTVYKVWLPALTQHLKAKVDAENGDTHSYFAQ
jgi:hypothetical protein